MSQLQIRVLSSYGHDRIKGRVELAWILRAREDHFSAHEHEDLDFRLVEAVDQRRVQLRLVLFTT